ncbi:MAG: hypothetical protein HY544_02310 [Candidatus Diapherotrites archaeon]|uniref:Uncharacterized protein n=1 Tax=Candidatus Iainarchaeum sp. TaxID=3101447 RepID=A0A8T3YL10_9ARCH|nr:hypothetical protein [Candidatus Diapherotrites archaeon]
MPRQVLHFLVRPLLPYPGTKFARLRVWTEEAPFPERALRLKRGNRISWFNALEKFHGRAPDEILQLEVARNESIAIPLSCYRGTPDKIFQLNVARLSDISLGDTVRIKDRDYDIGGIIRYNRPRGFSEAALYLFKR